MAASSSTPPDVKEWVPGDAPHLDAINYSETHMRGPYEQQSVGSPHAKSEYYCVTADGWRLHLVRTQAAAALAQARRVHPVVLCPGLCSSGAHSFDLAPAVSLADFLAARGWDVWTVEMRGQGMSDHPRLFRRSRWWTIDDHIALDMPAVFAFVTNKTGCAQAHYLGHSMGGMVLTGVVARNDATAARVRSCIAVGSGCFLEGSWWQYLEPLMDTTRLLWTVPAGSTLRLYSNLTGTRFKSSHIDRLYFWPYNTDLQLARTLMARNFSDTSVGVILQFKTAFREHGLLYASTHERVADPRRLAAVTQPAMFIVGDRDRMCPPEGCRKTLQMFGSKQKRFVCLGPAYGQKHHYGHFDILMGINVDTEVFPILHDFLLKHDTPAPKL